MKVPPIWTHGPDTYHTPIYRNGAHVADAMCLEDAITMVLNLNHVYDARQKAARRHGERVEARQKANG